MTKLLKKRAGHVHVWGEWKLTHPHRSSQMRRCLTAGCEARQWRGVNWRYDGPESGAFPDPRTTR